MAADVTTTIDPGKVWLEKANASLRESYGCSFDFWSHFSELGWVPIESGKLEELVDAEMVDRERLDNLLEQVSRDGIPGFIELAKNRYLLAIPLHDFASRKHYVATSRFETDTPDPLLQMGEMSQRFLKQESEIARLGEENAYFLKQVSDDFEELTFLRFMAERLCLGDGTNTIHAILSESLERLGEAIKAETLCFIDGQDRVAPEVKAIWRSAEKGVTEVDPAVLVELVENHREAAKLQPVIKNQMEGLENLLGVHDFVLVAVSTSIGEIGWFLAVNRRKDHLPDPLGKNLSQNEFGTPEASLLSTAAAMLASHASNLNLFQERETLLVNVVQSLVSAVEAKDGYTCGHSERVALYAKRLAQQVGYSEEDCDLLYLTGLLHDVGKIGINDAILQKPDALTEEEFDEIKKHPDDGWAILRGLKQLSYVLPGVLHHHERYDGKGYPDGLVGEDIPRDGRVLAVADAFDAMTSDRAYRQGIPQAKAEEILRSGAGTQWDEEVIEAFFEVSEELSAMRENYQPRERPAREPDNSFK